VVVIVRERHGNSVPAVFKSEAHAAAFIKARVAKGSTIQADEAGSWDGLQLAAAPSYRGPIVITLCW
jgi:hypothetical protein